MSQTLPGREQRFSPHEPPAPAPPCQRRPHAVVILRVRTESSGEGRSEQLAGRYSGGGGAESWALADRCSLCPGVAGLRALDVYGPH